MKQIFGLCNGWFHESYRHSLAARGIKTFQHGTRTSLRGKWQRLVIDEGKPLGWGSAEFMNWLKEHNPEEYDKMLLKIQMRNEKLKQAWQLRKLREAELKGQVGVEEFNRLAEEKRIAALNRGLEEEFPGLVMSGTIKPKKKEKTEDEEYKAAEEGYDEDQIEGINFFGSRGAKEEDMVAKKESEFGWRHPSDVFDDKKDESVELRKSLAEELGKDSKNTRRISELRSELRSQLDDEFKNNDEED